MLPPFVPLSHVTDTPLQKIVLHIVVQNFSYSVSCCHIPVLFFRSISLLLCLGGVRINAQVCGIMN